ncbi:hypothetical protein [Herpetosiphon sp. NSE202]|uniref:hypothetical protein n=1 Tax=Herpetosiphon sp. NSE202 TaxID=3351349 RepID=UPI00363FD9F8
MQRSVLRLLAILVVFSSVLFRTHANAQNLENDEISDTTIVIVVSDISDSECSYGYGTAHDTPDTVKRVPCKPGTVFNMAYLEYGEVKQRLLQGDTLIYFSDTGNFEKNLEIAQQKSIVLKKDVPTTIKPTALCTEKFNVLYFGTYGSPVSGGGTDQIQLGIRYDVDRGCMVRNVRPDTRLGTATTNNHTWNKSKWGSSPDYAWNHVHTINWYTQNTTTIPGIYAQNTLFRDFTTGSTLTWYDAYLY